jgi:hypothetical protein
MAVVVGGPAPDKCCSCDEKHAESRDESGKRIVFTLFISWSRGPDETMTPEEEYSTLCTRVEETSNRSVEQSGQQSALYMGCSEGKLGAVDYNAVIVLRSRLATVGEVKSWFVVNRNGTDVELDVREPADNVSMEVFLDGVQRYCERGGETYGERIEVERGDAETLTMMTMEKFAGRAVCGDADEKALERLNGRMATLRKSDEELLSMMGR